MVVWHPENTVAPPIQLCEVLLLSKQHFSARPSSQDSFVVGICEFDTRKYRLTQNLNHKIYKCDSNFTYNCANYSPVSGKLNSRQSTNQERISHSGLYQQQFNSSSISGGLTSGGKKQYNGHTKTNMPLHQNDKLKMQNQSLKNFKTIQRTMTRQPGIVYIDSYVLLMHMISAVKLQNIRSTIKLAQMNNTIKFD